MPKRDRDTSTELATLVSYLLSIGLLIEMGLRAGSRELQSVAWLLTLAALVFFVLELQRFIEKHRNPSRWLDGHCRTCGYDLRASYHYCPECGTPIQRADPASTASAPNDSSRAS